MPVDTITKNGKRRYVWSFNRIIEGERVRKTKIFPYGTTRADADSIARKWEEEVYAVAVGIRKVEPTIGDCVRKHITDKNQKWKDKKKRVGILEKWRAEYDDVPVSDLHNWSIQLTGYLRSTMDHHGRPKKALADGSIKNIIAYIRAAVRYSYKVGMVDIDHTGRLVIPVVANERHNYPERAQMLLIARACTNRQVRAAIRMGFYSGMRQSEILRAVPTRRGYSLGTSKNGAPRIVPIHPKIAVIARRIKFDVTINQVKYYWNHARAKAGFPGTRFHDLRHSSASEMINEGVDLFTVGAVLGHKSVVSTKRYSHLVTDTLANAIGRIGKRR